MEESGYVNVFSKKDVAMTVNLRNKVDVPGTSLPTSFRMYGFSVWVPANNVSTIFRFYDGDATVNPSTPLWTMRFWQHSYAGWNSSNMMMQDDSYIQINNGLYFQLQSTYTDARAGSGITVYF